MAERKHDGSMWCGAINCSNSKSKCPDLSFHRFPEDPERSKRWVVNSRRKDLAGCSVQYLNNNVRFCSAHFEKNEFYPGTKRLRKNAAPTIFNIPNPPPAAGTKRPLTDRHNMAPPAKRLALHSAPMESTASSEQAPGASASSVESSSCSAPTSSPSDQISADDIIEIQTDSESCDEDILGEPASLEEQIGDDTILKRRVNRLKSLARRQKLKIDRLEGELKEEKMKQTRKESLEQEGKGLSPQAKTLFNLQLRTAGVDPRGRRYSDEELMQALAIYFQGPRAYRFLQKQFVLPSTRILRKNMERIQLRPGFHDSVFGVMQEKLKGTSAADKMCVVSFDEMSIKSKLTYLRGEDTIEGYTDFGALGKKASCATHALVFMVRGVSKKWKQSVGYFLSDGPTKAACQKQLLTDCISRLEAIGLRVVASVCDMGATNQQTYKLLGVAGGGSYQVGAQDVVALYDVPHLFKCIRNTLQKHDVTVDGKKARWSDIVDLYHADRARPLRAAPKLKKLHVRPTPFKKMSVKLATQVMSRSVAAAMNLYAELGILPQECRDTAETLLKLNNVLDVLNSSNRLEKCFHKRAISCMKPATADQHLQLLQEADQWLGRWVVGDGSVRTDSVGGLRQTIRGVLVIWEKCKDAGLRFLFTRRLNQDSLENLFGVIRQRGGDRDNPDPTQFRHAYKHATLNNLMVVPSTANCEADADSLLSLMSCVAARTSLPAPVVTVPLSRPDPEVILDVPVDSVTKNCLGYVAGYLIHKADPMCSECVNVLVKNTSVATDESEILAALKSYTGVSSCDVGSLKLPTSFLLAFVIKCYITFNEHAGSMVLEMGIRERLVRCMASSNEADELRRQLCHPGVLEVMASTYTRLMLHSMCGRMTYVHGPSRQSRKLLKLQHR